MRLLQGSTRWCQTLKATAPLTNVLSYALDAPPCQTPHDIFYLGIVLIAAQTTPKIKKLCDELIRFDTRGPPGASCRPLHLVIYCLHVVPRLDQEITGPTDFKHTTHVGFNSKTGGFDVENLPAEWKRLFSQAGKILLPTP